MVERYKSHYEQHMKRIENVSDFIVAQEAIMGAKNMLRRLAHEPQIRWLFAQYCASDIPKVPRKACVIPRIQSTYCLLRERRQPSNEMELNLFGHVERSNETPMPHHSDYTERGAQAGARGFRGKIYTGIQYFKA